MIAIAYTVLFCGLGVQMIRWLMPKKSPPVRAWLGVSLGVAFAAACIATVVGTLAAIGISSKIALQVLLNIAVVTNSLPNTGISLPFFSYGGTALAIQLVEVGVVLSVSRQIPAPKGG